MSQIGIVLFGASAVFLVGLKDKRWSRWGFVCGLLAQPFWFYTTYTSGQWGIFCMSFLYTYSWANGFKNNWLGDADGQQQTLG